MEEKVRLTPYWLIALTFIGIADALFLSYNQFQGIIPGCSFLTGCEQVLTSPYSKLFGLPLSYFGLVFYLGMLVLAVALAVRPEAKLLRWGVLLFAITGLLFSIAFESIQIFIIGALCIYCAISAATTLALFIAALWHFRRS